MPTPFYTGYFQVNWMTQGIYDAVKDNLSPYQLYLMQDTNNAYLGTTRLFDVFHLVDSFDEPYRGDAKPKSLCVKLTQGEDGAPLIEAKILQEDYTFTELVPPIMGEIVDEDLPEDRTVPTRHAVWKFVDDRLIALQEYFDALENRVLAIAERAEQSAARAHESELNAQQYAEDAEASLGDIGDSVSNAQAAANDSENYAKLSKSWAVGGTGTRMGEDTNNAMYYSGQAEGSDTSARLAAQAAEYARNGAVDAKVLAESAQTAAESAATNAADETADAIEDQFRDDLSALSAAVNSAQSAATQATTSQQAASTSAVSAQQSAEDAYEYARQAGLNVVLILDAPPTVNTAAAVGKLAIWHDTENDKNHIYHLGFISVADSSTLYHWEECVLVSQGNVSGGYPVLDANGKVSSSTIPIMTNSLIGGAKIGANLGIGVDSSSGSIYVITASLTDIDAKHAGYKPIAPNGLNYAVRSVLPLVTEIPAATSDYSLVDSSATTNNHSHVYSHSPTVVPTYRLPQVTNTTIAHYIELTVDFTNVQTYSFLDYQGEPIVPLFTPSIAVGDVYTFKMEYSAIKGAWLIYPQKQGAVADDFVMRGEVGAANGVPSLDANAKVPAEQLPIGGNVQKGIVAGHSGEAFGVRVTSGVIAISKATDANIDDRTHQYRPIVPYNLNYAVTAALTDANHITLTDAQKATAQEVFGVGGPITAIPAATSQYTLSYGRFSHVPELASTYVLPAVADGTLANDIVISIKFSSTVLTYEFQDSAGNTLVPLPLNGDIEAGSVVTFLCRYNQLLAQWVIYPVMDGKEAE